MKFIDEAKIYVKAGDGGRGCVSFRREKYVPWGGPDGGDGGKGGDVIIRASGSHRTLLDLKYKQHHVAGRGGHGSGNNRTGRDGADVVIYVPLGTVVKDAQTGEILADLTKEGEEFVVARGGRGGRGNAYFASATNQAPHFAQPGLPGEERWIKLELKLLADVGIVGFPNVGKSTFIGRVSKAKPKVADYPFTTLTPNLGVVQASDQNTFVIADIPGLIEGAHRGLGQGIKFLRHIERTKVLLHMIDISEGEDGEAIRKFETINKELAHFSPLLLKKPQLIVINKIDLPQVRERFEREVSFFRLQNMEVYPISSVTGEGIKQVIDKLAHMLAKESESGE